MCQNCENEMHLHVEMSLQCKVMSLAALARVVLYNRVRVAISLFAKCELARRFICVVNDLVAFKDPLVFDAETHYINPEHLLMNARAWVSSSQARLVLSRPPLVKLHS